MTGQVKVEMIRIARIKSAYRTKSYKEEESNMIRMRKFAIAATAALILALGAPAVAAPGSDAAGNVSVQASTQAKASGNAGVSPASASSCHATLGPLGASQCFTAVGPGLFPTVRISTLKLEYYASWNICNATYQFKYKLKGATAYTTVTKTTSGCSVGGAYYKLTVDKDMVNGSQVCARQKNSATDQVYTDWYCHDVWG